MILLPASTWSVVQTPEKGRGVFVTKSIPPGTVIGDYTGRVISPDDDSDEHGLYGMCWSDHFVIMPNIPGIGLHLINHSCMPNCGMYPCNGHMLYISLRTIFPHEELTVSYVVEPSDDPKGLYTCYCKTQICTGTMMTTKNHAHEFWDLFVRPRQGIFADTPPVPMGELVTIFPSYPTDIPDYPVYDLYGNPDKSPFVYRGEKPLSVLEVRNRIRTSGLCIADEVRQTLILGVREGKIVTVPLKKT